MSQKTNTPAHVQAPQPGAGQPAATAALQALVSQYTTHMQPMLRFPGGQFLPAESVGRKLLIRAVAVLALLVSLAYLVWRALFTLNMDAWWISVPFLLLEVHAVISLALFTFSLWDVSSTPAARPVEQTSARLAVLIPTYNEAREILLPTIAAAVALKPAHETWVLDDGNRPWVAQLAGELGARYLARSDRSHAKAGNINNALQHIDADFVAVLDADHVARPEFLIHTLGYFDDERVALVQTPQDFYNLHSFEHAGQQSAQELEERHDRFHEQGLFYRIIQPGKNRWGAAFWCGTGALLRMTALRQIGGVATGSLTEDIQTSIRLHRLGWKTVYHNEVLARGLAASTADQYQLQRNRWGTGAMQVIRSERPMTGRGLKLGQRLAYASTLLGWFESWRSLGYLLMPVLVLFTGAVPILADWRTFLVAFGATLLLQQAALQLLSRGYRRIRLSTVFDLVRLTPCLVATLSLLRRNAPRFRVTPKGRTADDRERVHTPGLLIGLALLSLAAGGWFVLTSLGLTPLRYAEPWVAYGAAFWGIVNAGFMVLAIGRVRALQFAGDRRAAIRFEVPLFGSLDGRSCIIDDISLTGALIALSGTHSALGVEQELGTGAHGNRHTLSIKLRGAQLPLEVEVRSSRKRTDGRMIVGLRFLERQELKQARLALALFNAQLVADAGNTEIELYRPAMA